MITVAMMIPQRIAREDFLISISSRDAIRDPVHAPVPGNGIHEQHQTQKLIFLHLITFSHCTVFHFYDQTAEKLCFLPMP